MRAMQYNIHTLKNGLRVVLAPMPGAETATVIVMTGTGSRYENDRENGLAHFLEHMFFKGTKKRPSAKRISEELDGVGAVYNAYTSKDRTAYYAKVSARYLNVALDVISDIFLNSTLPVAEIAKERGAVIQEIGMYEDMPMRSVGDVFDALVFGEEPLGRTVLGPKENIANFTRKEFVAYLKRNYVPGNTVVFIAGALSKEKTLASVKRAFGGLAPAPVPVFIPHRWSEVSAQVAVKEKLTDQTQLVIGVPAYPYLHKDEFAQAVLAAILGGGMSSRLFIEVREKRGLAYSVHAWADKYADVGYLAAQAGVDHDKLERAVVTILAEFGKLKRNLVSKEELAKAKSLLKGTKTLSLETSDEIAGNAAGSLLSFGKIRTLEQYRASVDRVSAKDVQRVARELFTSERLRLAVIGPNHDEAALKQLLRV
jgi:predicted Zn-dependent peptidase